MGVIDEDLGTSGSGHSEIGFRHSTSMTPRSSTSACQVSARVNLLVPSSRDENPATQRSRLAQWACPPPEKLGLPPFRIATTGKTHFRLYPMAALRWLKRGRWPKSHFKANQRMKLFD
ncbi:hypothetical protein NLM33_48510 (plasmid) [Bradyrhizobium sp. CCGUVB1N3]|uniref:hypothetical protein n=1 Tax=Bradyrhizobium sp. CCGUVB1N3 TaxID=2949629 RepID=UPI0020B27040|nr:hypothetical protein [Bradyrhizobium sp. CCGUVB1N3]MCP3477921.1 hypothetical protein [Bradyrhizobium sp. CCGUVB1N3]